VYQLYVRSFADANGDGKGDLAGIRSKLAYLAALGVDAIWLNPCYPSPQADGGYDVSDYFGIEPDYGTLADFHALVAQARAHGIRILMDVVPNHCSSEHPWFSEALKSAPRSNARGRFYFRDGNGPHGNLPPNNWQSIFGGSAWHRTRDPEGTPGQWYLALFTPHQPDLNWDHPEVPEMFEAMLTFWFDAGVEGFRADAVTVLGKSGELADSAAPDQPDSHALNGQFTHRPEGHVSWRRWRRLVDNYNARNGRDVCLIAEADTQGRADILRQYVNEHEFHQAFAFDLMLAPWHAPALRDAVRYTVDNLVERDLAPAWTLNNHDAQRCVTRYGRADATDPDNYVRTTLDNVDAAVDLVIGTRRAGAAATFALALPGSIYLYMGEELGLPEVLDLPDNARRDPVFAQTRGEKFGRDGCRIPIPWRDDPAASYGFSPAHCAAPWLPQPSGWGTFGAEAQQRDPGSMLALYKRAIQARRLHLGSGVSHHIEMVLHDDLGIVAFERSGVLVVMNVGPTERPLDPYLVAGRRVVLASATGHTNSLIVPPDTTLWLADLPAGSVVPTDRVTPETWNYSGT
jgi:alpha-glucosidase